MQVCVRPETTTSVRGRQGNETSAPEGKARAGGLEHEDVVAVCVHVPAVAGTNAGRAEPRRSATGTREA